MRPPSTNSLYTLVHEGCMNYHLADFWSTRQPSKNDLENNLKMLKYNIFINGHTSKTIKFNENCTLLHIKMYCINDVSP